MAVKLHHPYNKFLRNVRLSQSSANRDFFRALSFLCVIIASYKTSYLLTDEFLVGKYSLQTEVRRTALVMLRLHYVVVNPPVV